MTSRVSLLLGAIAVLIAGTGAPLFGQDAAGLGRSALTVNTAWGDGDVRALQQLLDPRGIKLTTPTETHPQLTVRQMVVALEAVHTAAGQGPSQLRQTEVLGGDPMRGFAELEWTPKPPGVEESLRKSVYIGFEQLDAGWRIIEVRILG